MGLFPRDRLILIIIIFGWHALTVCTRLLKRRQMSKRRQKKRLVVTAQIAEEEGGGWGKPVWRDIFLWHLVGHWDSQWDYHTLCAVLRLCAVCRDWKQWLEKDWLPQLQQAKYIYTQTWPKRAHVTLVRLREYWRELSFQWTVAPDVLAVLGEMRALTMLSLYYIPRALCDKHLAPLTALRKLCLTNCRQLTDASLCQLTQLSQLSLRRQPYCTDHALGHLTQLSALSLDACGVRGGCLTRLVNLTVLRLTTEPDDQAHLLDLLPRLTQLRQLVLSRPTQFEADEIDLAPALRQMSWLVSLDLHAYRNAWVFSPPPQDDKTPLLPRLQRLSLSSTRAFTMSTLLPLLPQLTHLSLEWISNTVLLGTRHCAQMTSLCELTLCNSWNVKLHALLAQPTLSVLKIHQAQTGLARVKRRIRKLLQQRPPLQQFCLNGGDECSDTACMHNKDRRDWDLSHTAYSDDVGHRVDKYYLKKALNDNAEFSDDDDSEDDGDEEEVPEEAARDNRPEVMEMIEFVAAFLS